MNLKTQHLLSYRISWWIASRAMYSSSASSIIFPIYSHRISVKHPCNPTESLPAAALQLFFSMLCCFFHSFPFACDKIARIKPRCGVLLKNISFRFSSLEPWFDINWHITTHTEAHFFQFSRYLCQHTPKFIHTIKFSWFLVFDYCCVVFLFQFYCFWPATNSCKCVSKSKNSVRP